MTRQVRRFTLPCANFDTGTAIETAIEIVIEIEIVTEIETVTEKKNNPRVAKVRVFLFLSVEKTFWLGKSVGATAKQEAPAPFFFFFGHNRRCETTKRAAPDSERKKKDLRYKSFKKKWFGDAHVGPTREALSLSRNCVDSVRFSKPQMGGQMGPRRSSVAPFFFMVCAFGKRGKERKKRGKMHRKAAQSFVERTRQQFPAHFADHKRVLDMMGKEATGANRHLFDATCVIEDAAEHGIDECGVYDTIVATNCLEHDQSFVRTLRHLVRLLKPGGLFVMACAAPERSGRASTRLPMGASVPSAGGARERAIRDAKAKIARCGHVYPTYFCPLSAEDVQRAVPVHLYFDRLSFESDREIHALFFWGVRNDCPFDVTTAPAERRALDVIESALGCADENLARGHARHRYTRHYHTLLDRYRYADDVRVLQVGVESPHALGALRAYLPNASFIVGTDRDPAHKEPWTSVLDHLFVETGSSTDAAFLTVVAARHGPFDIVIDTDVAHAAHGAAVAFETLFPLLKDGGVYIAEGAASVRHPALPHRAPADPKEHPDHLAYFYRYLPALGKQHESLSGSGVYCGDPDKVIRPYGSVDPLEATIDSVLFGASFAAIVKRTRRHWLSPTTTLAPPVRFI